MDQYHIYDSVGRGRYSVVYKGRRKKTIQYYAIKSVEKQQKQRVLQEVRIMHSLHSEYILKFHAWYETKNHLWLILEYCVGGDLQTLLRQDKRLPEASVHDMGRDLVAGLQFLHSHSIVYCDLKPSNVLLDENGRLKLCDFGLSRRLSDIAKECVKDSPAANRGTPCYMAPELFEDGSCYSFQSDLWALGCVLYECCIGQPPFYYSSFTELMNAILHSPVPDLDGQSTPLLSLISTLLVKDPVMRLSWEDLRVEPFWRPPIHSLPIPAQPSFQQYLKRRKEERLQVNASLPSGGAGSIDHGTRRSSLASATPERDLLSSDASHFPQATGLPPTAMTMPEEAEKGNERRSSVNVLRLSKIVKSNQKEHEDRSGYGMESPASDVAESDVHLKDADQELDFSAPQGAQFEAGDSMSCNAAVVAAHDLTSPRADTLRKSGRARSIGEDFGEDRRCQPERSGSETHSPCGDMDQEPASVQDLMWHSSDVSVRPIVLNKRIERAGETGFDQASLAFEPMTLPEMLAASQDELEKFLALIYRSIGGATPLSEKMNTLAYFESLCCHSASANILINSSLMTLFLKLLRTAKSVPLKIRLTTVMGIMLRHATFIADDLAGSGIVEALTDALRDRDDRLRRTAMATLGELIFYVATQRSEHESAREQGLERPMSVWTISSSTVMQIVRLLRVGEKEDETVQHYAVKMLENVGAHGGEWTLRFTSQEVTLSLVNICTTTKNEYLRATASSTLFRLLRHSRNLVNVVVDKIGVRHCVRSLRDQQPKIQQSFLNILNLALLDPNSRTRNALAQEKGLVSDLINLLEHATTAIRMKSYVCLLSLSRLDARWLLAACRAKLPSIMDRATKTRDPRLTQCIKLLRDHMIQSVPEMFGHIKAEMDVLRRRKFVGGTAGSTGGAKATGSAMQLFPIVPLLISTDSFRGPVIDSPLICKVALFLQQSEGLNFPCQAEFKASLLTTLELVCQRPELLRFQRQICDTLLPVLLDLLQRSSNSDTRFLCLKLFTDITQLYLGVPEVYDKASRNPPPETVLIDNLVSKDLLPAYKKLLVDEHPIPLYAQKLLVSLLQGIGDPVIERACELDLPSTFFSFLSLEHSNNNVHNARVCKLLLASPCIGASAIADSMVVEKVLAILQYAIEHSVQPFLEVVLHTCCTLLDRERQAGTIGEACSLLVENMDLLLEGCLHPDQCVAEPASSCIMQLALAVPETSTLALLSVSNAPKIVEALDSDTADARKLSPGVLCNLLAAVSCVCDDIRRQCLDTTQQAQGQPAGALAELNNIFERLKETGVENRVVEAAAEAQQNVELALRAIC